MGKESFGAPPPNHIQVACLMHFLERSSFREVCQPHQVLVMLIMIPFMWTAMVRLSDALNTCESCSYDGQDYYNLEYNSTSVILWHG